MAAPTSSWAAYGKTTTTCTIEREHQRQTSTTRHDNDSADDNSDSDDDDDGNNHGSRSGITINYGGAPSFDTDLNSYGSGRRTFDETGFTHVTVAGGYRVVVSATATAFKIEAGGDNRAP